MCSGHIDDNAPTTPGNLLMSMVSSCVEGLIQTQAADEEYVACLTSPHSFCLHDVFFTLLSAITKGEFVLAHSLKVKVMEGLGTAV